MPAVTEFEVVRLSAELPELLIDAGAKLPLMPEGRPDAVRVTAPVKLLSAATLTENVVPVPAVTV